MKIIKVLYLLTILAVLTGLLSTGCEKPGLTEYNDPNPAGGNPPILSSVVPATAFLMDTVTISGSGFSGNVVHNFIKFGNKAATILSATASEIKAIVPEGSGDTVKVQVAVRGAVNWSEGIDFAFKQTITILDEEIVHPCGVAVDKNGDVYVGGRGAQSIFKISSSGEKSVFVADIPVNGAMHFGPDNYLYVCEQDEGKIVRITSDGNTVEDFITANGPIDFDWDSNGTLYVVSNWEGIYRKNASGALDYVVEDENIKTIRILNDKVYAGGSWANEGYRFDITGSGLENKEVIISADDLVFGMDLDINGRLYYGIYSDPTLHTLDSDGTEGSMYGGMLTAPMRFMTYFGKCIYAVNTGGGDAGVVLKIYTGVEGIPRYGVN